MMRIAFLLLWGMSGNFLFSAIGQPVIVPTAQFPSFLYQGDQPKLPLSLLNTGATEKTGNLQLELWDGLKKQSVDGWLYNQLANQYFTLNAGERQTALFPLMIPYEFTGILQWQMTVRVDSVKKILQGNIAIHSGQQADTSQGSDWSGITQEIFRTNPSSALSGEEESITSFDAQPLGQPLRLRITLDIPKDLDSCEVHLPIAAGLQLQDAWATWREGKPSTIRQTAKTDTAVTILLYDLIPGLYQWDYHFIARYPGRFLVPGCRLQLFQPSRRAWILPSQTIEIE